jgi:hypothetical protein
MASALSNIYSQGRRKKSCQKMVAFVDLLTYRLSWTMLILRGTDTQTHLVVVRHWDLKNRPCAGSLRVIWEQVRAKMDSCTPGLNTRCCKKGRRTMKLLWDKKKLEKEKKARRKKRWETQSTRSRITFEVEKFDEEPVHPYGREKSWWVNYQSLYCTGAKNKVELIQKLVRTGHLLG